MLLTRRHFVGALVKSFYLSSVIIFIQLVADAEVGGQNVICRLCLLQHFQPRKIYPEYYTKIQCNRGRSDLHIAGLLSDNNA
jgi:hypothetical protein